METDIEAATVITKYFLYTFINSPDGSEYKKYLEVQQENSLPRDVGQEKDTTKPRKEDTKSLNPKKLISYKKKVTFHLGSIKRNTLSTYTPLQPKIN